METLLGVFIGLVLYRIFNDDTLAKGNLGYIIRKPKREKPSIIIQKKVVVKVDKKDVALIGALALGVLALTLISSKRVTNNTPQQSSSANVTKHLAKRQNDNAGN